MQTNLSAAQITKLTGALAKLPLGRLATAAKTAQRFQRFLAQHIGEDRATRCGTADPASSRPRHRAGSSGCGACASDASPRRDGCDRRLHARNRPGRRRIEASPHAPRAAGSGGEGGPASRPAGFQRRDPRPVPHQARPDRRHGGGRRRCRPPRGRDQPGLVQPEGPRPLPHSLHHRPRCAKGSRGMKTTRAFAPADRCVYDFGPCSTANDWAQIDTAQDASYFGTWANPTKLMIFYLNRDRPGAVVLLGPERPAGMDEQHFWGRRRSGGKEGCRHCVGAWPIM